MRLSQIDISACLSILADLLHLLLAISRRKFGRKSRVGKRSFFLGLGRKSL
jgi:hypothetical protein